MAKTYTLSCTTGCRRATSYNGTYYVITDGDKRIGRQDSFYWGVAIDVSGSYPSSSIIDSAKVRIYVSAHGTATSSGTVRLYQRYYDSGITTSTVGYTSTSIYWASPGSYVDIDATAHIKAGITNLMLLPNNAALANKQCYIDFSKIELLITTTETTYTLSYDANGGSGAPSAQSATTTTGSATFTVSSIQPTRSAYEFLGWSTNSTATTASYSGGNSITISSNTTLYAVWKTNTVQIFFHTGAPN